MQFPEEYHQAVSDYLDAKHAWLSAVSDYDNNKLGKKAFEFKKMAFRVNAGRFAEASLKVYVDAAEMEE